MITLALALFGCCAGFLVGFARGGDSRRRLRVLLAVHLAIVAAVTVGLQLLGTFCGAAALACGTGMWFALLTTVHIGHRLAVSHWSTPLDRTAVAYGLANLRQLSAAFPNDALRAAGGMAAAFVAGAASSWCDLVSGTLVPTQIGRMHSLEILAATACAIVAMRLGRVRLWREPLLRLAMSGREVDHELPAVDLALAEPQEQVEARRHRARAGGNRSAVVVFVVDSLRARNLPFHGYARSTAPFLESLLAGRGARAVPLAAANCASSECGSWSLLTSRRYRHLAMNSIRVHEFLRQAGYRSHFLMSGIQRGWRGLEHLYGVDHDTYLDGVDDSRLVAEAAKLPDQAAHGADFFLFHLMSVHSSVRVPRSGQRWPSVAHRGDYCQSEPPNARMQQSIVNDYDNAILQADQTIGEIMRQLERKKYLRDAVVLVTADHGESLGDRPGEIGELGHANSLFQECIHLPMIVMDTRGGLPETAVLADQTDLAPTVADLLGLAAPEAWQGQSVFRRPFRGSTHVEFTTFPGRLPGGRRRAMEAILMVRPDGHYKLLRHREAGQETLRAVFDLSRDPLETHPIDNPAIVAELEALRGEYVRDSRDQAKRNLATPLLRRAA